MFNKNTVLTSVGILYRDHQGKRKWLAVKKNGDSDWELPRITVRKTESSARAAIRMAGELLASNAQIIDEVGRSGGMATVNGRSITQRQLYYLLKIQSQNGEVLGFTEAEFFEYAQAVRKLISKRDRQMLKAAKDFLKKVQEKKEKKLY
jgi:hypothetical protein